jgi:hypothetical protein
MNRGIRVDSQDPRLLLAQRLRALRKHWPSTTITQHQLARALDRDKTLSVPLISSWESLTDPKIPPVPRLEAYAALFATPRSLAGGALRLIDPGDMSDAERQAKDELLRELLDLRNSALRAGVRPSPAAVEDPWAAALADTARGPLSRGPLHFADGGTVTIVCAQWPKDKLTTMPYTEVNDPDYIELLTYSDLDSLVMSYGHVRAANPASQVEYFRSGLLPAHSYSSHLVSLGGTDWNEVTESLLRRLGLPVEQVADWRAEDGQFFEVEGDKGKVRHRPLLEDVDDRKVLLEDIALFARAVNPFNRKRTATICYGMYGRGTYGVVRALTDPEFWGRNIDYLESRFEGCSSYCLLTRVTVEHNKTMTPDWTDDETRLFEWSGPADAG